MDEEAGFGDEPGSLFSPEQPGPEPPEAGASSAGADPAPENAQDDLDLSPKGNPWGSKKAAEEARYGGGGPRAASSAARDISDLCALDIASAGRSGTEVKEGLREAMRESSFSLRSAIPPTRALLEEHGLYYTYEDTGAALFGLAGKWEPSSPAAARHRLKLKYRSTPYDFEPADSEGAVEWAIAGSYALWDELLMLYAARDREVRCEYMTSLVLAEMSRRGKRGFTEEGVRGALLPLLDSLISEETSSAPELTENIGGTRESDSPSMTLEEAQRAASRAAKGEDGS